MMSLFASFRRLWGARPLPASTAPSAPQADATTCMLQGLQQLCATLPDGQAEVWLHADEIRVSLHWKAEGKALGDSAEKPQETAGLYFLLNGDAEEIQVAEMPADSSENTGCQEGVSVADNKTIAEPTVKATSIKEKEDLTFDEEEPNKPNRQQRTLKKLLRYLELHYTFRYNRLTDRTECAAISETDAKAPHRLHYQPADNRVLNSISLQVIQAGIACWDRDIKRYVESAEIPSYHPFTAYMENLPQWDGTDRVTPLAQRVSRNETWVKGFHRWMLATTAQWLDAGHRAQRANSVAPLLISTRQGLGKSTFCRMLLPDVLQDYFTESFDLTNPSTAENKLASFGLINLDEFDRLPASRMPQLKNMMQMERLHIRRAYKHSGEPLPRIASFIGTSNRHDLLTDRSGSRRFICVEVEQSIDCTTPIEYEQLYAQLKHELEQGERSWFNKEEEAEIQAANEAFYRVTPAEEVLGECFAFAEPGEEGAHLLSAAQIYAALKGRQPALLQDCTPLAFSKLLAQVGKRVHTKYGNGYWVKPV